MGATQLTSINDIDASKVDKQKTIAVLPLGATEQHGPHLPFETDWLIAEGICKRLICKVDEEANGLDVRFLPVEKIGYSKEHIGLKKDEKDKDVTRSLEYNVAIKKWISIGKKLHNKGVKKLVLLNAHGGNSPLLQIVAQELRVKYHMLVVVTKWTRFIKDFNKGIDEADQIEGPEQKYDIHAGEIETSVILALDVSKASKENSITRKINSSKENFEPTFGSGKGDNFNYTNTFLHPFGPHSYGWIMSELNDKGAVGNAEAATIKKGENLLEKAVDGLIGLLKEIRKKEPPANTDKQKPMQKKILTFLAWPFLMLVKYLLIISVSINLFLLGLSWPDLLPMYFDALAFDFLNYESDLLFADNIYDSGSYYIPITAMVLALASIIALTNIDANNAFWTIPAMVLQTILLLGIFAAVYHSVGIINEPCPKTISTSIYFSIVTWTTLGYGDLQPVQDLQMLAAMEAMIGYLFLGSLVGVIASRLLISKK